MIILQMLATAKYAFRYTVDAQVETPDQKHVDTVMHAQKKRIVQFQK